VLADHRYARRRVLEWALDPLAGDDDLVGFAEQPTIAAVAVTGPQLILRAA
jgi:hypothetical protein